MLGAKNEKFLWVLTVFFLILALVFKSSILGWLAAITFFFAVIIAGFLFRVATKETKLIAFCPRCNELSSSNFKLRHLGHTTKYLEIIFGPWRRGPIEDPMIPSYIVARHNGKIFFIKRSKENVDDPMSYEFVEDEPHDFRWRWRLIRLILR